MRFNTRFDTKRGSKSRLGDALSSGQLTHGGLDLTLDSVVSPTGEVLSKIDLETEEVLFGLEYDLHHDGIDRGHYLNLGSGAAVSLTDSVELFGSFVKAVAVRNGHAVNRGITVGVSWTVRLKAVPVRKVDTARASARSCDLSARRASRRGDHRFRPRARCVRSRR